MADYQVKILPLGTYEDLYGFLTSMVVGKTGKQDGNRGRTERKRLQWAYVLYKYEKNNTKKKE